MQLVALQLPSRFLLLSVLAHFEWRADRLWSRRGHNDGAAIVGQLLELLPALWHLE